MDSSASDPSSATARRDLRRLAAERKSWWLSNTCAALALFCGTAGLLVMFLGHRGALTLLDTSAASGQKFTPAANALFAGVVVGAVFELTSLLLLGVALLHSRQRSKTLLAGLPALVFPIAFIALGRLWNDF